MNVGNILLWLIVSVLAAVVLWVFLLPKIETVYRLIKIWWMLRKLSDEKLKRELRKGVIQLMKDESQ